MAVAVTADTLALDPKLWEKVDRGDFRIVYACPEILLDRRGHFSTITTRLPAGAPFMNNLVLCAIDECHLIWDWESFRTGYRYVGNLRRALNFVPWACLSATLMPGSEGYVHKVLGFDPGMAKITQPIRRDNINLAKLTMKGSGFNQLYYLISSMATGSAADIPKTIIYVDNVNTAIQMARELRAWMTAKFRMSNIDPNTIIRTYYGRVDAKAKSDTLSMFKTGECRIVIATEAFGLGVHIPNILRVIQWGLCEKVNAANLFQRVGRAARDNSYIGTAVIYIQRELMNAIEAITEHWREGFVENTDAQPQEGTSKRVLSRYKIPVEKQFQGQIDFHVGQMYEHIKSLKDAYRQAREAGTNNAEKLKGLFKLDPGVLWIIMTEGCMWQAFLRMFNDPTVFSKCHRSWCCTCCARTAGKEALSLQSHDVPLHYPGDASPNAPEPIKVVSTKIRAWIVTDGPPRVDRDQKKCSDLADKLIESLETWRATVHLFSGLPKFLPDTAVMSDRALEHLVENSHRIVSHERLREELKKAKVDVDNGALDDFYLERLLRKFEDVLDPPRNPVSWTPFPGNTPTSCLILQASNRYRNILFSPRAKIPLIAAIVSHHKAMPKSRMQRLRT
jgi:hypothetical protein